MMWNLLNKFWMKECGILGGQNIIWPILNIIRGSRPPTPTPNSACVFVAVSSNRFQSLLASNNIRTGTVVLLYYVVVLWITWLEISQSGFTVPDDITIMISCDFAMQCSCCNNSCSPGVDPFPWQRGRADTTCNQTNTSTKLFIFTTDVHCIISFH